MAWTKTVAENWDSKHLLLELAAYLETTAGRFFDFELCILTVLSKMMRLEIFNEQLARH